MVRGLDISSVKLLWWQPNGNCYFVTRISISIAVQRSEN